MMDTLFFFAAKIFWLFMAPDSLLLLILLAGLFFLYLDKQNLARIFLSTAILTLCIIAFLPLDEWLAYPLENRFPANPELPARVDGIIMLGGSVNILESSQWMQVELNNGADRNAAFITLARRYPEARLVFSGGSGKLLHQDIREADIVADLFSGMGLDSRRIIFERESRNTYENAIYSKTLVNPDTDQTWVLVTSSAHMPRAIGIFCQQGWSMIPYPVDHNTSPEHLLRVEFNLSDNLGLLSSTLREWIGLSVYFATGKIGSLLPSGCHTELN